MENINFEQHKYRKVENRKVESEKLKNQWEVEKIYKIQNAFKSGKHVEQLKKHWEAEKLEIYENIRKYVKDANIVLHLKYTKKSPFSTSYDYDDNRTKFPIHF